MNAPATAAGRPGKSALLPATAIAALFALLVGLMAAPPAGAAITKSSFPTKKAVKTLMNGRGTWYRGLSEPDFRPLGARPKRCRSDRPFRDARESRSAGYGGQIRGTSSYGGSVSIEVHRFSSKAKARKAMARVKRFVRDCPRSVEWVCTQCDGIFDITRKPARKRKVGTQSLAWRQRVESLGIANGKVIAARTGRVVVVTAVAHAGDPVTMRTPPAPSWRRTVAVAKKSLRKAVRAAR